MSFSKCLETHFDGDDNRVLREAITLGTERLISSKPNVYSGESGKTDAAKAVVSEILKSAKAARKAIGEQVTKAGGVMPVAKPNEAASSGTSEAESKASFPSEQDVAENIGRDAAAPQPSLADLNSGRAFADGIKRKIAEWVAQGTNNGARPMDRNWERSAVKRFVDAYIKAQLSGTQTGKRAAAKIAVAKSETFADLDAAIEKYVEPSQPAQAEQPASGEGARKPLNSDQAAIDQADADFNDALGDLGDIIGKNFRATLTPEQEQKLLPVLTKLFDAAFRKGYYKFKEAARFVLDAIKAKFGAELSDQISLKSLQGAYIGMSGRYEGQGADEAIDVVTVKSKNDLGESHVTDQRSSTNLERNRQDAEAQDGVGAQGVRAGRAGNGGAGGSGVQNAENEGGSRDGSGVSGHEAVADGERGNLEIYSGDAGGISPASIARDSINQRSDSSGLDGSPVESDAASVVDELAESGLSLIQAKQAQFKADKAEHKPGLANIRETLPILTSGQQEDVHTAETRFSQPDGYGMMFTNGTGTGKAQPLDAKILTPTGWKCMGDMRVGDEVIAGDGSATVVTGVYPQGEKPIFRVEFSDGAATECCDEHLWLTQTLYARRKARANADWGCAQPQVRQLSEIRASLDSQHFIPVVGEVETHSTSLPIPAYTLGVILGDGCLRGGSITFSGQDAELADFVAADLPQGFHVVPVTVQENRCPAWIISADTERLENGQFPSHPMIDALRDLGLFGMDSFGKFIPETYLFASRSDRIAMLRGLMDTDGTVDYRTGSVSFSSVSPQLRDGVIALVRSMGGIATYTQRTPTYTHNGEKRIGQVAYTVCIHISNAISLFALSRKQNLVTPKLHAPRRKIVGIVEVGAKQAQCISVAHPSHLYVTDDYIVTHNTFTGLGIIKRFDTAGKHNILITAPNDKIALDWETAGKLLSLKISRLENTKSAGEGIVITTYANFGANNELAKRDWDLIVHDEAHYLKMEKTGADTNALHALRAISLHPDGVSTRINMIHADLVAALKSAEHTGKLDRMSDDQRDWAKSEANNKKEEALRAELRARSDEVKADVAARQGESRPRVLFLSATPFAYEKTVDYGNGYLFDYNEGRSNQPSMTRDYNAGSNSDQFMMQHFGYRMRTGKLTQPDAKVDSGLMQRQFNTWLKKRGVLAGRMLDVKADYDRRFILVESAIGQRIDAALQWFEEQRKAGRPVKSGNAIVDSVTSAFTKPTPRENALGALRDTIGEKFDYLSRRYLLEAIKAQEVIPHVKEHMALGRKVVVFHDYKKGGGFNPFDVTERHFDFSSPGFDTKENRENEAAYNAVVREFRATFRDLIASDVWSASSPITAFQKAFPGVLLFNGDISKGQRRANVEKFQDDASGVQVMLVQSAAGKEGISLHDTTGKYQRVLFNLGQPTQPTTAIQEEGRIYRTGQVTDAIFRYLNTGTGWEKWAFATTIAQRASAAENLGIGEQARALKDAFIAGFDESDDYRAGMEDEGKGGKERDKAANKALTEYDRARAFYFGTQKKNSRTKAQEGSDYFATPEPVGLKMVELADIRIGEATLEPSAGHGAIARWMPENSDRTAIEPSMALRPRLAMVFDGNIIGDDFESLHVNNKYDAIVMNPPFGSAGRTAVDHIAKAATHLREGGRIVALLPVGSATTKFDKWFYEESTKPVKPLFVHPTLGEIYKGDTLKVEGYQADWKIKNVSQGFVELASGTGTGITEATGSHRIVGVNPIGARTESFSPTKGLNLVAEILMPSVTFERAGTAVNTRIVVIEKSDKAAQPVNRDYTDITDINELFDRMENLTIPARAKPVEKVAETPAKQSGKSATAEKDAKARDAEKAALEAGIVVSDNSEATFEIKGDKLITNAPTEKVTTAKGKELEGVFVPESKYTKYQLAAVDAFAYYAKGKAHGVFVRLRNVVRPGNDAAKFSQSTTPANNPHTLSTLAAAIDKAMGNGFTKLLEATGKFKLITSDQIDTFLKGGAKFSKSSQVDGEYSDRSILLGHTYFKVGASVIQDAYEGAPAKIASINEERNQDITYTLEIDVSNHPEGIDENGERVSTKRSLIHSERLLKLNPLKDNAVPDIRYSKSGRILAFVRGSETFLVADNISSTDDSVKGILTHEISAHALSLGRSEPEFQSILKQFTMMGKMGNKKVQEAQARVPKDTPAHLIEEESLGYYLEKNSDTTLGQKLLSWFRAAIRKIGKALPGMQRMQWFRWAEKLSPEDIVYMAQQALKSAPQTLGKAKDRGTFKAESPFDGKEVATTPMDKSRKTITVDGVERPAQNSNGQPIHWSEEGTRNFWRHFGDSVVVDEDGKPQIMRHGSVSEFHTFDKSKIRPNDYDAPFNGFWFTTDDFASPASANPKHTIEAYLSIQNPASHKEWRAAGKEARDRVPEFEARGARSAGDATRMLLQDRGYDGVLWEEMPKIDESILEKNGSVAFQTARGITYELRKNKEDDSLDLYDRHGQEITGGYIDVADYIRTHGEIVAVVFEPSQIKSATGNAGSFSPTNPDIRFSRAPLIAPATKERISNRETIIGDTGRQRTPEQIKAFRNVGRAVVAPTLEERAKGLWKDAGKKLAQGLVDQFRPIRDLSADAYALMRLSKGASGAFEVLLKGGKLKLTDGVYDFDEAGSGGVLQRLLQPLQGEADDFLWWVAANRAERLSQQDREHLFTKDDITAIKSLVDGQTTFDYTLQHGAKKGKATQSRAEVYADALKTFNEFNKNTLDMAEQSGLIDGESRALWESEFYVPFYRVEEDDSGVRGMNIKSGVVRQQAFKHLKGGTGKLNTDLLENTLMNWAHLLDASAKNRAAKASLEAAARAGVAVETESASKKSVWFMDNGRKRHFAVSDPMVLDALVSLEYAGMRNPMMTAMGTMKHVLTIGVTASPFFKVRNLIRDSVHSIAVSGLDYNVASNVKEGWKLTSPESDAYFRLLAGGGTIHFGTMLEGNESKRVRALVASGVDESSILNDETKYMQFYHRMIEPAITAYNELGNRGEAVNRAALYNQLIRQGKSHAEASLMARDLMDFSMQGAWTSVRFLAQTVPFFNARIQGLYKLGRSANDDPKKFGIVLGAVATASVALMLAYNDDDDWKKREDWDRDNYWWFKIGGEAFRIPKPFEIGAIASLAERGVELFASDEMTGKRFMSRFGHLLWDNLAMNPVPQLVKPMLDIYANKDSFTGRQIETMGMERLDPEYRYTQRTSMAARAAGELGASPMQVDHLIRGYFGWLGTFIVGSTDIVAKPLTGQIPGAAPDYIKKITGGMVASLEDAPSRYISQMYEQSKEIEQAYGTWRHLLKTDPESAASYNESNIELIKRYRISNQIKRIETNLNQRIRMIERSALDPEEKRMRIRKLNVQKDDAARKLVNALHPKSQAG